MAELNDLVVKGDARFLGKVYMKDYIDSRTYSGIYGSANDQDNASFYFGYVRPINFYDVWKVGYKVYASVPGQNNYRLYSEVEWYGNQNGVSFKVFNRLYSTSYRCYLYHNVYYLNSTGYTNGYSHALGIGLRDSTNPTSSSYPRTFKIELVYTENCTFTFLDSMVKRTSIPGAGTTNFQGVTEANGGDNGLQETGDNTNVWQLRRNGGNFIVSTALYRYQIVLQKNETTLVPINAVNNDVGTSKTLTTDSFNPFAQILYYNSTTTVNANSSVGASALYEQMTLDLRYSFNTGTTLTTHKDVYLVAVPQSDGLAKLHTSPISQILPTTADGLIYIYLGRAYSNYQIELHPIHPVYEYKDGALRQYTNSVGTTYEDATTTTHGLMSAVDKVKLNSIATGAEVNQIEVVKVNGTAKSITNKTVDITVPTKTSDLTNDSNFNYSIEKSSGTIDDLAAFTSGKPGITGSISLTKKSSGVGSEIPGGWYNYYFSPHRTGIGGDNINYGTIILTPMTFSGKSWILRRSSSATTISEVKSIATGDIPTVNNATLTIQKNGTNVQTFAANQSTNATANITVPTKVSELTNDSGYTKNTGTVTSVAVKMNNTTKGTITTSGTIDLGTVITAHQDISGKENTSNKVTSISSSSTNTQYPSALAVYNYINSLNGNEVSY